MGTVRFTIEARIVASNRRISLLVEPDYVPIRIVLYLLVGSFNVGCRAKPDRIATWLIAREEIKMSRRRESRGSLHCPWMSIDLLVFAFGFTFECVTFPISQKVRRNIMRGH